ncbi:MAG TPA: hypothetical protein VHS96_12775 [Bacteroidia bacterium]|nr:hypothetical protein [Bacteroidia bacterium]
MGNRLVVRAHKTAAEKRMIRIRKRMHVLWDLDRHENEERVPLEEPKFWGYRRHLILRKDVASRGDARTYFELLQHVQKVEDSRRKDFKAWNPKLRRWEEWRHTPSKLNSRRYERLPRHLKSHFYGGWDYYQRVYRIIEPWVFESRRHKLWITHRFIPNVELKQELAYLNALETQECLQAHGLKVKCPRRNGWKKYDRHSKPKLRDRVHRLEMLEALEIHASGRLDAERGKEGMHDAEA